MAPRKLVPVLVMLGTIRPCGFFEGRGELVQDVIEVMGVVGTTPIHLPRNLVQVHPDPVQLDDQAGL